jgi:hypothetical protein
MKFTYVFVAFFFILQLAQCSSIKKLDSNIQSKFNMLLERSEQLDANTNSAIRDYENTASELKALIDQNDNLRLIPENIIRVENLLKKYQPIACEVTVVEPDEKLYTSDGFDSPVIINVKNRNHNPVPPYYINISGTDSFLLNNRKQKIYYQAGPSQEFSIECDITQASFTADKNKFTFSAEYKAAGIIKVLSEKFNIDSKSLITVSPPEYKIKTIAGAQNRQYDEYADKVVESSNESYAGDRNFMVQVKIADNGQFTIGGVYNDKDYDLMYGHPNSTPPNEIWSSFISIKIDNNVYLLNNASDISVEKKENGTLEFKGFIRQENVRVNLLLKPEHDGDIIKTSIKVIAVNESNIQKNIGVRFLLDTWAGINDGVPFLLPSGKLSRIIINELEFTPSASAMWQTFDPDQYSDEDSDAMVFLQNINIGKGLVPPDRIAFANWPSAYETAWDYFVDEEKYVTGDSAVIMWWEPLPVKSGKDFMIATQLGSIKQKKEPVVFMVNEESGIYFAILTYKNTSNILKNISYSIKFDNGEISSPDMNDMSAELKPGEIFIKALPLHLLCEEPAVLSIIEDTGTKKTYSFPVKKHKSWNKISVLPVVTPEGVVPVNFFHKRKIKLKARIVDNAGRIIKAIDLKRSPWLDGYRYNGKLPINADLEGRYYIEVYR